MATIRCDGDWVQFDNEIQNQCFQDQQEDDDEEEEEALSLCDLPTNNIQTDTSSKPQDNVTDDFQFGPCHRRSPQNMCSAEDVFFQGRILPLSYSVSSHESTRRINRSASMSVVRSNESENEYGYGYKPKVRNLFHSHPSPSPQIRTQSFRMSSHSNPKTTSLWSFLQVGLVKPQEIGLSDLKNRSKRFGSHNSNSSSNSSSMNSTNDQNLNNNNNYNNQNQNKCPRKNTKKKPRMFFGGCKCSAGSIDQMVKDRVPKKTTKEENMSFCLGNSQVSEESTMIGEGKQTASRHRTFEWLKQLSIAAPSEA